MGVWLHLLAALFLIQLLVHASGTAAEGDPKLGILSPTLEMQMEFWASDFGLEQPRMADEKHSLSFSLSPA